MTIAEKLQIVLEQKNAIKAALESQGKSPSDDLSTYAGLINDLENPDQVTYCVTIDGETKTYATLYGEERAELTATANDIRKDTVAITDSGITIGEKDIPSYHSRTGKRILQAKSDVVIPTHKHYNYTQLQCTIAKYRNSISDSVEVIASNIDNSLYEAMSTNKLSEITIDDSTQSVNLGIVADEKSVLRYFSMKEEY